MESYIQQPMQAVFYTPVSTDATAYFLCIILKSGSPPGSDIITSFSLGDARCFDISFCINPHKGAERFPTFLVGVEETARLGSYTLSEVLKLKERLENQIRLEWGRRTQSGLELLNRLFEDPVVRVKEVEKICQLSPKASGDLVQSFDKAGILHEFTGQSRNRIYVFEECLNLFK